MKKFLLFGLVAAFIVSAGTMAYAGNSTANCRPQDNHWQDQLDKAVANGTISVEQEQATLTVLNAMHTNMPRLMAQQQKSELDTLVNNGKLTAADAATVQATMAIMQANPPEPPANGQPGDRPNCPPPNNGQPGDRPNCPPPDNGQPGDRPNCPPPDNGQPGDRPNCSPHGQGAPGHGRPDHQAMLQKHLNDLVSAGKLTAAQAQTTIAAMAIMHENKPMHNPESMFNSAINQLIADGTINSDQGQTALTVLAKIKPHCPSPSAQLANKN